MSYKKPSVSELIALLDKPGLLYWANKIGLQGTKLSDYKKQSTGAGISLHQQISEKIKTGKEIIGHVLKEKFSVFEKKVNIIDSEIHLETDYFTGRADIRFSYKGNDYISDFKSSQTIYLEHKLQLCAYKMAFPDCNISITNLPDLITTPIKIDFEKGAKILIALSEIYKLKNEL